MESATMSLTGDRAAETYKFGQTVTANIIIRGGRKMQYVKMKSGTFKLSEAIETVEKLTVDCNDIKEAVCHLENYTGEDMESFIAGCADSKRVSVVLLVSSLVVLEEDLRMLLNAEITIKEVPDE
jgi:hypothetical protein